MKRDRYTVTDREDGQRRLDHYNKWLMDPTREFGIPYPGYPENKNDSYSEPTESVETEQNSQVFRVKKPNKINKLRKGSVTVAQNPKVSHNTRIVNKIMKGSEMAKVTNLSRATEIVKASASKAEALDKIVAELNVKRANAFVYFTKASKALGDSAPKAEKVSKAAKPAKAKVAEIDKVIAGLKASGVKVASPFAALASKSWTA